MNQNAPKIDLPPPLNNTLGGWLHTSVPTLSGYELYAICSYVHNQFPQFNEKSSLKLVQDRLITNKYLHKDYGEAIYRPFKKPAKGWHNRLARFWTRMMPASYWVALRERFPELARRNDGYEYGSVIDSEATFTRTVQLKPIGYRQEVDRLMILSRRDSDMPHFDGEFEFMCGYEALTDMLYIHEKFWLTQGYQNYPVGMRHG